MSSAISKFTASLLAGSQETTLALAALNFDFSLYKVEAPVEYQGLGASLSNNRRTSAESGLQHITARKLGALFRSEMPPVPRLINAYGRRVSEIAQTSIDPQLLRKEGLFSEQIGIDGTSIWAAATSGPEALGVLLLACMLARFWSAQEATSIWVEIVETRKHNLRERENHFDFPQIAAMQATFTREQLAEWDASARAWLRTADHARSRQQTQLRLIVENVHVDVSEKPNTYDSVMHAWTSAMTTIDNLVAGVAQSVQNGSVLLGLSAWHLYPDMQVYEGAFKEIKQGDSLIAVGGLLTVGLETAPNSDGGVRWSLPLAKLRYYGEPVVTTKKMNSRSGFISFEQLIYIALGSLLIHWQVSTEEQEEVFEQFSLQWRSVEKSKACLESFPGIQTSWLRYFAVACETFLTSRGNERATIQKLIAFGQRHCDSSGFVSFRNSDNLIYGIRKPSIYIPCLIDVEDRIAHLRRVAENNQGKWIIIYNRSLRSSQCFATAGAKGTTPRNFRWAAPGDGAASTGWQSKNITSSDDDRLLRLESWSVSLETKRGQFKILSLSSLPVDERSESSLIFTPVNTQFKPDNTFGSHFCPGCEREFPTIKFEFSYGDPNCAALYCMSDSPKGNVTKSSKLRKSTKDISFREIKDDLEKEKLDPEYFLSAFDWQKDADWRSLQVLGIIGDLYNGLPHAKISVNIATKPLLQAKWITALSREAHWYLSFPSTRAAAFSCIALMESGDIDLNPTEIQKVMALSINDSLYLAEALISDPSELHAPHKITRVLGNIGKAGLSLLIPPPHPMVRKPKAEEWNLINHEDYDGKAEDLFTGTSLHLSLTEYRVPYATTHEGSRDLQTSFQEAVVSIYDRSVWVADVNILEAFEQPGNKVIRLANKCLHISTSFSTRWPVPNKSKRKAPKEKKLSIADSWLELLDQPDNAVVVRSSGNWLGRLAASALTAQLGNDTFIVLLDACQKCFGDPKFFKDWAWSNEHVVIY